MHGRLLGGLTFQFSFHTKAIDCRTVVKILAVAIVNNVLRVSMAIPTPLMAAKPVLVPKLIVTLPRVVQYGRAKLVVFAVLDIRENCAINAAKDIMATRWHHLQVLVNLAIVI